MRKKKIQRKLAFVKKNLFIGAILAVFTIIVTFIVNLVLVDLKITDPKFILSILGVIIFLGLPTVAFICSAVLELMEIEKEELKNDIWNLF